MALSNDLKSVREALVLAIETAWPSIKVTSEFSETEPAADFAQVALKELEFDFENPLGDEANVSYCLNLWLGRQAGSMSDLLLDYIEVLRDELLVNHALGGVGYAPLVKRVEFPYDREFSDDIFPMSIEVTCYLAVNR